MRTNPFDASLYAHGLYAKGRKMLLFMLSKGTRIQLILPLPPPHRSTALFLLIRSISGSVLTSLLSDESAGRGSMLFLFADLNHPPTRVSFPNELCFDSPRILPLFSDLSTHVDFQHWDNEIVFTFYPQH